MIVIAIVFRRLETVSITQSIVRAGQPYCECSILPLEQQNRTPDIIASAYERMPKQENSFMCACAQKP
ncbi:hypothetical protein SAMN05216403_10745 [Nitrosospira multiformis ATCC 25196]|uniref:Uncharacterized protein n=1 Tax=Nitrosospira multiformis (strain ATCC 25196 / NCIMB 11849 / C 71) TaxID=323848 RepID=A0A1H5UEW3_NITMU|nr:hypothetical protein SAMN05216403_10745 [Nitrosospira multiformis ATCC 25196]